MSKSTRNAVLPSQKAKRRACLYCSILLSPGDFKKRGCPNCDEILQMKGSSDRVSQCTSAQYDGIIAVMRDGSWVAKWQRTEDYVRGLYAARVMGKLPDEVIDELEAGGYIYQRRDEMGDE
ncbi:transcription initiation protein spt4 [Phaffia rhodozyma]|uniref:Transcription elongation factor SPT4 n=1 Tax=Phaffia rhodozyma TaxID=264483 RepID=A0A0F7SEJ2_PHARH|nr:transcription initiation protein spt4 [Phaffia rhodozyma]